MDIFAKEWTGGPFVLFGPGHLIALGIILLVNLLLPLLRGKPRAQRFFRYGAAAWILLNEIAWHVWNWSIGQWDVRIMLPFHLCSVLVPLTAYMLVTKSYRVYEFAYFLGIGAAMQALLTPDAGPYGFPHFRIFQTLTAHGLIVTSAVYMTVVEGYRPQWKSLWRVILGVNLYMIPVAGVNALLGSNYLFIAHKPETASLIDMLGPWPWYILGLEAVGLVLCLLLYLPFAIRDWRQRPRLATAG